MRFLHTRSLLILQSCAVAAAFTTFGLWPPATGRMLLVSIDSSSRGDIAKVALSGGAALMEAGFLPNSMIVSGNRADIAARLDGRPILILAASDATCGKGVRNV